MMRTEHTRPLSLGPVFAFEWLVASRRWQGYALRSGFVAALLAALIFAWMSRTNGFGYSPGMSQIRLMAYLGQVFYTAVIGTQLTLVLLAAPAATAGAICLDRARGTLTHLLLTDLSDGEVVLGKLAARLVPVFGLVGCTLPVMALLSLLGGVDPDALLGAFMVTLGVALLGSSLALAFSLWAGKTHEALLATYAVWALWLLSRQMFSTLQGVLGVSLPISPWTADPFLLVFAPYWWPGTVGMTDFFTFLLTCTILSAGLAALAVVRLRPVCLRENVRSAFRKPNLFRRRLSLPFVLPGPSLDGNPVFWREWHRGRSSRWSRSIGAIFVVISVVFAIIAAFSGGGAAPPWFNALHVSIGLLFLSVSAATSLAEERVRGSLDVLMATPLPTHQIVMGKWLGSYRYVPPLAILPAFVILVGGRASHSELVAGAVLVVVFVLVAGAVVTSLGLALATIISRLGRAVGLTVTLYLLVTIGWLFVGGFLFRAGPRDQGLLMASPFFFPGELAAELCMRSQPFRSFDWACVWIVVYFFVAIILLLVTLTVFDGCLGRVNRLARVGRRSRGV